VFQSYAHFVLVSCFAAFLAVAFAVVASGSRDEARRRQARPGTPLRVQSHRAAYYEWMARHDGRRRPYDG
jgi:hypothetical protein